MNKKMLIGNIIGILVIIGIVSSVLLLVSGEKKTENKNIEKENQKQVNEIIQKEKDTNQFQYSEPIKQEDGIYKIKITNKETKKSQAYYLVDLKKNEYTLVATGHAGKEVKENVECETGQKDS